MRMALRMRNENVLLVAPVIPAATTGMRSGIPYTNFREKPRWLLSEGSHLHWDSVPNALTVIGTWAAIDSVRGLGSVGLLCP